MKIGVKIILGYSVIIFAIAAIIFFGVSSIAVNQLTDSAGRDSLSLAHITMQEIDKNISTRLEQLGAYSYEIAHYSTLQKSNQLFSDMPDSVSYIFEKDHEWSTAPEGEITEFMRGVIESDLSNEVRKNFELKDFYQKEYGYPIWSEVFITNKFGINVAETNKTTDYYQADEVWWQKSRIDGNYIGDINFDKSSNSYSLDIAVSIKNDQGEFLGVVKGVLNINNIIASVKNIESVDRAGTNNERELVKYELFTHEGKIIYPENESAIYQKDSELTYKKVEHAIASSGKDYFLISGEDNSKKIYALAHSRGYHDYSGLGWSLLISRDAQEITALIKKFINAILVVIFLSAVVLVFLGYFISRLIVVNPIRKLQKGVEMIKNGTLDYEIETRSQDEIGQLSRSFREMVLAIKKSRDEVDQKVFEQTKLISAKSDDLVDKQKAILNVLEDMENEKNRYEAERDRNEGILRYLHSIGEGIVATDTQEKIIFVNLTAAKLVLRTEGSPLFGRKYSDEFSFILGKGSLAKKIDPVAMVLKRPFIYILPPNCYLFVENKSIPVSGSFAPIIKEGKILGVVGVFQDITERHNIEKEKDEFLSIAAHQLRTPLTGIRWTIESLLDGDAGKMSKEAKIMLAQIFDNNQRLITLVNDLLDVSRINMGKAKEELVSVNICNVLQEAITALSGFAKERKVEISYEKVCAINPFVKTGPKHIFQALENILSNAIKYTAIGGIVKTEADYKKDKVIISISDDGIGIPKKDQDRIFSKFFRASNAVLKETEGSGLGLSVVKSFIEESGGKIWFESEEGKGTTFFIELPMA
jgi:signal transduction histidine kinase